MNIELIDTEKKANGEIVENYIIDGGAYQVILTKNEKYITHFSIYCNRRELPRIKFDKEALKIVVYTDMPATISLDSDEEAEALARCNYAYNVAKAIKVRFLKG